jgi:hypothetical protein
MDTDRDMDVDVDMIQIGNEKHDQFAVIILHVDNCWRRFGEETFC